MPLVPFPSLPDDARCWVFGALGPLDDVDQGRLLVAVDAYLTKWTAHGTPLTCGREFREEFFLAVGVDERASNASGCSIDGLFTVLQGIEKGIGTTMVGGGLVHFRDRGRLVHSCTRLQFEVMAREGEVDGETIVFDTTLTTVGAYRARFSQPARATWHAQLLAPQARK